jgi:hypothetical protein
MRLAILAAAGLALAGCTTLDAALQANLPRACATADTAYAGYVTWRIIRTVPERLDARVQAARVAVAALCRDPANATGTDIAIAAATLAASISAAKTDS